MKLYTDCEGNWRGTQAEARKDLNMWQTHEVPTSKAELLIFLNAHKVADLRLTTATNSHEFVHDDEGEVVAIKPRVSAIDESNLKLAYEQAGLARESLKRVFHKLEELKNENSN